MTQGPCRELSIEVNLDALRARLRAMTDDELLKFGKQMHGLVLRFRTMATASRSVSAFSIQLEEARAEWRRRRAAPRSSQR